MKRKIFFFILLLSLSTDTRAISIDGDTTVQVGEFSELGTIDDNDESVIISNIFARNILAGDFLFGWDDQSDRAYTLVTDFKLVFVSAVKICTETRCLIISRGSKIYTGYRWKQAINMRPGDFASHMNRAILPVVSVQMLGKTHLVRFRTEQPLYMFANGFIVAL